MSSQIHISDSIIKVARIVDRVNYASSIIKYNDPFLYKYWQSHISEVMKNANKISMIPSVVYVPYRKVDIEVIQLAALLHDISSIIDFNSYHNHHIIGVKRANTILRICGIPLPIRSAVCDIINSHRGSQSIERISIESKIVASADAIATLENFPKLWYFIFKKANYSYTEGMAWLYMKVGRSYAKVYYGMTPKLKLKTASILEALTIDDPWIKDAMKRQIQK